MKIFLVKHTQISAELTSVCFWIVIADQHLQFLQTKHLQCILKYALHSTYFHQKYVQWSKSRLPI